MRRIALAVVLLLALVSTASMGSAASLTVRGGVIDTFTSTRPCADGATATAATAGTAAQTQVRLTVPPTCVGRSVQVTVVDAAGVARSSAAVPMTTGTQSITVGAYTATPTLQVRATVDGWNLATSWSWTPPTPHVWCTATTGPGTTCSASLTLRTTAEGVRYWDVVVTTTSASYVRWEVSIDTAHPFFGGLVPTRLGNSDLDTYNDGQTTWGTGFLQGVNDVVRQNCGAAPLRVVGINATAPFQGGNNFRDVRNNRERRFSIVVDELQAGYDDLKSPGCL